MHPNIFAPRIKQTLERRAKSGLYVFGWQIQEWWNDREEFLAGAPPDFVDEGPNLVVDEGLDYIMDTGITAAALYVGLTDGTPTVAAGDTMASHAGWAKVHSQYSEATRPEWVDADVAGAGKRDNSASKAVFTFTGSVTVGGSFITSNNTKNGTTGTLVAAVAFTGGDQAPVNGNVLNVTHELDANAS